MQTGFEGYLVGVVVIMALIAFLWRALGRLHVTVTNNNSPTATASAESAPVTSGKAGRNVIGGLLTVGVLVAVFLFVAIAVGNRVTAPTVSTPIEQPVKVIATPIPIAPDAEYVPVELPAVNTALDMTPLIFLIVAIVALYVVMRSLSRKSGKRIIPRRIDKIKNVEGLTADLFTQAARNVERSRR